MNKTCKRCGIKFETGSRKNMVYCPDCLEVRRVEQAWESEQRKKYNLPPTTEKIELYGYHG